MKQIKLYEYMRTASARVGDPPEVSSHHKFRQQLCLKLTIPKVKHLMKNASVYMYMYLPRPKYHIIFFSMFGS